MYREKLSIAQKRTLESWVVALKKLPKELRAQHISTFIKLYRKRLRMTQKQLAKRAGVSQPFIARLERGFGELSTATLKKIFQALYCELVLTAVPAVNLDKVLEKQAERAARKKMHYLKGTMALEEQLPKRSMVMALLRQEKRRLLESGSSEIWDT